MSPEEIALEYPYLTLAQAHAALAYYHVNRGEIETDIAEAEAAAHHREEQLGAKPARQWSQARLYLDEDPMRDDERLVAASAFGGTLV